MEKKLMKFNEAEYNAALKRANIDLARYNDLLNSIKKAIPEIDISEDQFLALIAKPKEFAFDVIMTGKTLELSGVPIGKEKAMNLIEYPANWLAIIKVVDDFNKKTSEMGLHKGPYSQDQAHDRHGIDDFTLCDGKFNLCPNFLERVKDYHSIYTQNDNQNKALEHLNAINIAFNELRKLGVRFGNELSLLEIGFSEYGGVLGAPYEVNFDPTKVVQKVRG